MRKASKFILLLALLVNSFLVGTINCAVCASPCGNEKNLSESIDASSATCDGTIYRVNGAGGSGIAQPNLPIGHTGTLLPNGNVLFIYTTNAYIFNPGTAGVANSHSWTSITGPGVSREDHIAVLLCNYDDKLLPVAASCANAKVLVAGGAHSDTWQYFDTSTNSFTTTNPLQDAVPTGFKLEKAAAMYQQTATGQVLAIGGTADPDGFWIFDKATEVWTIGSHAFGDYAGGHTIVPFSDGISGIATGTTASGTAQQVLKFVGATPTFSEAAAIGQSFQDMRGARAGNDNDDIVLQGGPSNEDEWHRIKGSSLTADLNFENVGHTRLGATGVRLCDTRVMTAGDTSSSDRKRLSFYTPLDWQGPQDCPFGAPGTTLSFGSSWHDEAVSNDIQFQRGTMLLLPDCRVLLAGGVSTPTTNAILWGHFHDIDVNIDVSGAAGIEVPTTAEVDIDVSLKALAGFNPTDGESQRLHDLTVSLNVPDGFTIKTQPGAGCVVGTATLDTATNPDTITWVVAASASSTNIVKQGDTCTLVVEGPTQFGVPTLNFVSTMSALTGVDPAPTTSPAVINPIDRVMQGPTNLFTIAMYKPFVMTWDYQNLPGAETQVTITIEDRSGTKKFDIVQDYDITTKRFSFIGCHKLIPGKYRLRIVAQATPNKPFRNLKEFCLGAHSVFNPFVGTCT